MCGIAGYFALTPRSLAPREVLGRMVEAVRHRGPDDAGIYYDGRAALGHRRLSIIDLSGGKQPLATADGNLWVTFNGEIFNYVELRAELIARGAAFRTTSDTETILHAYHHFSPDCVQSLNGDFAYALWDRRNQRLVMARDRMGVRPLYYIVHDGVLVFASASQPSARLATGSTSAITAASSSRPNAASALPAAASSTAPRSSAIASSSARTR